LFIRNQLVFRCQLILEEDTVLLASAATSLLAPDLFAKALLFLNAAFCSLQQSPRESNGQLFVNCLDSVVFSDVRYILFLSFLIELTNFLFASFTSVSFLFSKAFVLLLF
jgi:hypothetical protein